MKKKEKDLRLHLHASFTLTFQNRRLLFNGITRSGKTRNSMKTKDERPKWKANKEKMLIL